jgi:MoxR-like ATPase
MSDSENMLRCEVCGLAVKDYLGDHLVELHEMTGTEYLALHPGASTMSKRLAARAAKKAPRREDPPKPGNLTVDIQGIKFPVNIDVPPEACLPLPEAYRFPKFEALAEDCRHAAISLKRRRHGYIHGMPGTGKDAFLHAVSALARIPCVLRSIKPGVNIQHWFYSRSFNKEGTEWERGPLLDNLTRGYEITNAQGAVIRRVPYMFLITDFDRADRGQAEHLRLITDTTLGRVEGPQGRTEVVLDGTMVWATGNSAGAGDTRGRCISSNVIDASIMDRFQRVYEFHWLAWKDEEAICREKFGVLVEQAPFLFDQVGKCTTALRKAIYDRKLFAEFSHRGVCAILGHAQDLVEENAGKAVPNNILVGAARAWIDRLGDEVTKQEALKAMDAHVPGGMLDNGGGPDTDSGFKF